MYVFKYIYKLKNTDNKKVTIKQALNLSFAFG